MRGGCQWSIALMRETPGRQYVRGQIVKHLFVVIHKGEVIMQQLGVLMIIAVFLLCSAATSGIAQTINACSHKTTGSVRILADGKNCLPEEFPISWNISGPPGPPVMLDNDRVYEYHCPSGVAACSCLDQNDVLLSGGCYVVGDCVLTDTYRVHWIDDEEPSNTLYWWQCRSVNRETGDECFGDDSPTASVTCYRVD
jgi:hypothetical protein